MKGLTTPDRVGCEELFVLCRYEGLACSLLLGLIPWFSKTEGNTYATLLHHPFLFKGKPTQCSRGSKKDFQRRCRGVYAQVKTYQVPITNSSPSHYIICHLPLVFLSPTSPLPFYLPSLSILPLFACLLFVCPCVRLLVCRDGSRCYQIV